MRIAVTGAAGFIGAALVERLARDPEIKQILAVDLAPPAFADPRIAPIAGVLPDDGVEAQMFAEQLDVIYHLASLPSGASALDYEAGWRGNFVGSLRLIKCSARQKRPPRFVFASSIGVFGVPLPDHVDDETQPRPSMSYGAQKLLIEIVLADFTRRGLVDGRAPRLPGIVARPWVKGGHLSGYLSHILHALAANTPFVCPVSADARSWLMSRERCVDNLIHAGALPGEAFGGLRAFTLPALDVSMADLVEGLAARFGENRRALVSYAPDAALEAQFGAYPPLSTPYADALGFRHDGDVSSLLARALGAEQAGRAAS